MIIPRKNLKSNVWQAGKKTKIDSPPQSSQPSKSFAPLNPLSKVTTKTIRKLSLLKLKKTRRRSVRAQFNSLLLLKQNKKR